MLQNPVGFGALAMREIKRFVKVYLQTIISPILSNLLFFGVFGGMFAARGVGIDGVGYLQFLVPGLCAMGALNAAITNTSSSLLIQKYQGIIQDLNTYPLSDLEKTLSYALSSTLRGVLTGLLTLLATGVFVGYDVHNFLGFVLCLTVISFIFSCLGIAVGLAAKTFESVSFVTTIIITPLTYFGGVFFEVTKLPATLASLAQLNPIFPMVDATRAMYLGVAEGTLLYHVIFLTLLAVGSLVLAHQMFRRGVGLKT